MTKDERRADVATILAAVAVALVSVAPFARGLASGATFYFRDLSRHFFPVRRFVAEGLRAGEVRYWLPWVHEGEPLPLPPPVSYPVDLLQVLAPHEAFFSLLLALHVPLAAVAFFALARGLGFTRTAAAAGALVYALGGFTLSTLSLYFLLQATAWAPLLVLALVRAAEGPGWRWVGLAGLASATALSTMGVEIAGQAILVGVLLAAGRGSRGAVARVATAIALGFALVAPSLLWAADLMAGSARAQGFATQDTLAFSLHPASLLQVGVAGLFGDLAYLTNRHWSHKFTGGMPYFLSLYLGTAALALAVVGARFGGVARRRLLCLAGLALVLGLGRFAGLDVVLDALPALRSFRFPAKAFFSVHVAVSVMVAAGIASLAGGADRRPWRWLGVLGLCLGGPLVVAPAVPLVVPGGAAQLLGWLFPPGYPDVAARAAEVLGDAAVGGALAVALGILALAVLRRHLAAAAAAGLAVALVAADLLRAGAGLNPMIAPERLRPTAESVALAAIVRAGGGRLFTCDAGFSGAVRGATGSIATDADLWTMGVLAETLTPAHNLALAVPTAYSRDLTMTSPIERVFGDRDEVGCARVAEIRDRLRAAGVRHVISFRPLDVEGLRLVAAAAPRRVAPLRLYLHALDGALPLRAIASSVRPAGSRSEAEALAREAGFQAAGGVAVEGGTATDGAEGEVRPVIEETDRLEFQVRASRPTVLVVRDGWGAGWSATVDGTAAPVLRADGRHRAVPVPAGRSRVVLSYRPPSLTTGLVIAAAGLALTLALLWRGRTSGRVA